MYIELFLKKNLEYFMICINGLWAHLFSYTDIGHIGYTKSWFYLSRYMLLNCSICCLLIYMVVIRIGQRQEDVLAFYGHDWWLRGSLLMIPSLVTLGIKSRGLIARFIEHSPLFGSQEEIWWTSSQVESCTWVSLVQ